VKDVDMMTEIEIETGIETIVVVMIEIETVDEMRNLDMMTEIEIGSSESVTENHQSTYMSVAN
jgi:hypothetical protein